MVSISIRSEDECRGILRVSGEQLLIGPIAIGVPECIDSVAAGESRTEKRCGYHQVISAVG